MKKLLIAILAVSAGVVLGADEICGAFSRRTRPWHALVATLSGFLLLVWVVFGQKILPLPWPLHVNLSIVFATLAIVMVGFSLGTFCGRRAR